MAGLHRYRKLDRPGGDADAAARVWLRCEKCGATWWGKPGEKPPRSRCLDVYAAPLVVSDGPRRKTVADLPCLFRIADTGRTVPCGCGARDKQVPLYKCAEFGHCTLQATGKHNRVDGKRVAICLGCHVGKRFRLRDADNSP